LVEEAPAGAAAGADCATRAPTGTAGGAAAGGAARFRPPRFYKLPFFRAHISCARRFSTMSQTPIVISLDGNIGAGKSTLLRALRAELVADVEFVDEPVGA
jgi:hypothetical protein